MSNQHDLALAYSPGVAAACMAIHDDAALGRELTTRGNLVAVVSNGTAVLGLGNIGPLAAKPVMEGKGCLFKKFAGIDVFDIEVSETDPDRLVEIVASLEPTFGGINLEDIKAPECFVVERARRPSPASTSWWASARARKTSSSPTARASCTRAAPSTWTTRRPVTPGRP